MRRHTRLAATGGALTLVLVATTACASDAHDPDPTTTVRDDEPGRTVARVDVDGDGRLDAVGYRLLNGDRVRLSVRTGDGGPARKVVDTELWPGPGGQWHGAAPLDGNRGAELVVGTTMGAHTPFYTVLSMRGEHLVVQPDPTSGEREWWTDAFYNGFVGWTRVVRDGEVGVVHRAVFREGDGHVWRGEAQRFRWVGGDWVRDGRHAMHIRGDDDASRIAGWHVPGLPA